MVLSSKLRAKTCAGGPPPPKQQKLDFDAKQVSGVDAGRAVCCRGNAALTVDSPSPVVIFILRQRGCCQQPLNVTNKVVI